MSANIKSSKAKNKINLSEEQRRQYIEVAAYHIAENVDLIAVVT